MDWKDQTRDLKQQFEEFWEQHNLQKKLQRGGRFSAPLCSLTFSMFSGDSKLFR